MSKYSTKQSILLFLFICAYGLTISCNSRAPLATVDGPEDNTVLRNVSGFILVDGAGGDLVAISLPDLKRKIVRNRTLTSGSVYAIAGPDKDGRIVYVENHSSQKKHLLKITDLDASMDFPIFERPGDAIWDSVIGNDIALSPYGEKVAFVGKHRIPRINPPDWHDKAGIIDYGLLEVWKVQTRTSVKTNAHAVDRGMSWFPDNQRLAYTTLLFRNQMVQTQSNQANSGGFDKWDRVPSVMILDLADGTSRFLHVGWNPVVSLDGKSVIISDLSEQHWLVDVERKKSQRIGWPGDWGGAISFVSEDIILYWGLPTEGTKQGWTIKNSPLVGRKPMGTLKLANFKTGQFKTVLSSVDPRWQVSFGRLNSQ